MKQYFFAQVPDILNFQEQAELITLQDLQKHTGFDTQCKN